MKKAVLLTLLSTACTCSDEAGSKETPRAPSLFAMHVEDLGNFETSWGTHVMIRRIDNDEAVCYIVAAAGSGAPSMQCKWRGM